MCGIAGLWDARGCMDETRTTAAIRCMTRMLAHRGPDDEGYWQDPSRGVALGHRRLSIVDLSPLGHQPMTSVSGRYVIAFNGEVYNHSRIRPELVAKGFRFRGHSDTEVMLAAIEAWGVEAAVKRFIGMFAFALWDRESTTLTLVRDRLGIKPLYYGWTRAGFVFGSELKALRAAPDFSNPIDRDALALLLRHSAIPAPYTIYKGVYKLAPGTLLQVDRELAASLVDVQTLSARSAVYWSAREVAEAGARTRFTGSHEEAIAELDTLLRDAVALRMEADVPLGAFLSGGVDSSAVVALMQAQSARPVQTFSIGFDETGYDEAQHAKAVARHLGTAHTELYVTPQQARDVIPRLPQMYDEPFSDSSQIPTFLVSELARRTVTVSLSGDGGDELFAGYDRYYWTRRLWQRLAAVPYPLRRAAAASLRAAPHLWDTALERLVPLLPPTLRVKHPHEKSRRVAELLMLDSPDALYARRLSHWRNSDVIVLGSRDLPTALTDASRRARLDDATERMLYTDLVSYLPDDILTKVDRASMATSLEARVPLLDHRVVEFAWRLPLAMKIHDAQSKWVLRQVLYKYVPRELIERPKVGFGVPIEHWLRGPLRDWAEALLDESRLRREGYLDPAPIRAMWHNHVTGRVNEHYRLWDVLMFQAWLEAQRTRQTAIESQATAAVPA
ncbi:MAG TPA: asparagine synthase (glutamine-hydrolyzing) [Gemmatimonadaceae bacterium]